ncbi:hydroxymethylglutaryl-CoA lyase [Nesterenkonia xinjiangensis]|uniref:Hydroxymethylglutaryl-CoA lyase n=1 Tax=Nesterenkonia xinjiangensis TaxID=225327 RepID=A0A7Z0GJG8_9MICC|nr:hydroxymethylglutaryl-CoA lyase [Nesterenkonia xinjiangensis]NYJ76599.1 hydroxymethylglutaryl-CoA lyase [Nesterenkonia xinjiangensis]
MTAHSTPTTLRQAWGLPDTTRVVEVGLRDGLQAISTPVSTQTKLEIVHRLIDAGVREIEVASFAHPRVLPQLADAEELLRQVPRDRGVTYRALVPNLRGMRRAAECEIDDVAVVVPADDGMALKNQNRTTAQLIAEVQEIGRIAADVGQRLIVAVACAFFAPCRGPVSRAERLAVVEGALEAGAAAVYLATTTGEEHPGEVHDGIAEVRDRHPELGCGAHLHNRNGFAPANALAALSAGADWLETSFSGLGGDMWFPGDPTVLGNMATEDLLHLLHSMGISTGIDFEQHRRLAADVTAMTGFPVTSFVARGGSRDDLAAARWPDQTQGRVDGPAQR